MSIKKLLSMIVALLMVLVVCASCMTPGTKPDGSASTPAAESTPAGGTSGSGESSQEQTPFRSVFTQSAPVGYTAPKEHVMLSDLPSSATLVGTDTLPPIDNQGGIGSCASQAIAYMQFTNAVAQYRKNNGGLGDWTPSEDYEQCYSPKFTYQFAGAVTDGVYELIMDHGALKNASDGFAKDRRGGHQSAIGGVLQNKTLRWPVYEGAGEEALAYRITRYDQTFVTNNALYTAPGVEGVAMTTSEAGREMLYRIKEAVATGNVVVTGGYPSAWQSQRVTKASGLAKSGDQVITWSTDERDGGHQVCIVGYDDNMEFVDKETKCTMKGAFLIANSWGEDWGKKGYMWCMYDALNTVSEDSNFKLPDNAAARGAKRDWTLDQFCFIYWDSDITDAMPRLYAEVELTVANRNAVTMEISKTDIDGSVKSKTPYMFKYPDRHDNYGQPALNADGVPNGEATTCFFTVSFDDLFEPMPAGITYRDFDWAIRVTSANAENPVTVKSIKVKDDTGAVVATISLGEGDRFGGTSHVYNISFFEEGKERGRGFLTGEATLTSVSENKYLCRDDVVTLKTGKQKDAEKFYITLDPAANTYRIYRSEKDFVLDGFGGLKDGAEVRFNKENAQKRRELQNWRVSYNADGTVSFYLTDEQGVEYALCVKNGGLCLKRADALTDDLKFVAASAVKASAKTAVTRKDGTFSLSGTVKTESDSVNVTVRSATGEVVFEKTAAVTKKAVECPLELAENGVYAVFVTAPETNEVVSSVCIVVKQ